MDKLLPCPFCGSNNLRVDIMYFDDDAECDGVECLECDANARVENWNRRSGAGAPLPLSVQEALNSGDGVYRP